MSYECRHMGGYEFDLAPIGGPIPFYGTWVCKVHENYNNNVYTCECCKFDRDGMICCHILKVMKEVRVYDIPETYILKRWTWDAAAVLGETGGSEKPKLR